MIQQSCNYNDSNNCDASDYELCQQQHAISETTHVASNHGWWQHSWVMIVITSDGSKNTRCQRPHAISVTTLGVDCIMMIYQMRILSLSFDIQWEYDVSSRCDVSSKCSLPTGTCFSTGNSLVYISIYIIECTKDGHIRLSDWLPSLAPLWLATIDSPENSEAYVIHNNIINSQENFIAYNNNNHHNDFCSQSCPW